MRHYPASNLTPLHPNSLQQVKPKGATDWTSIINDELGYVMDSGTMRIYKFVAASVLAESIPDVVIPDGNLTGVGRWEEQEWASGTPAATENIRYFDYTLATDQIQGDVWRGQNIGTNQNPNPGTLVRLNAAQDWYMVQADSESNVSGVLGLTISSGTGSSEEVMTFGNANIFETNDGGFDNAAILGPVYASTTPGKMSHLPPTGLGEFIKIVGYKWNNYQIIFNPMTPWIQIVGSGGEG